MTDMPRPTGTWTIGAAVAAARALIALRQIDVADATSIHRVQIANYERGVSTPTERLFAALAAAIEVPEGHDLEALDPDVQYVLDVGAAERRRRRGHARARKRSAEISTVRS